MTYVMEKKQMSISDLRDLVAKSSEKKIGISGIQSLMQCNTPKKHQDLIPYISRALLIEEDVLYKGYGASYGTWSYCLSTDFLEKSLDDETKKKRNKKRNKDNKDKKNKNVKKDYVIERARKTAKTYISNIISDEEKLNDFLSSPELIGQKELFGLQEKTDFEVYENDRRVEFNNLLDQDSIFVLLDVLEKKYES